MKPSRCRMQSHDFEIPGLALYGMSRPSLGIEFTKTLGLQDFFFFRVWNSWVPTDKSPNVLLCFSLCVKVFLPQRRPEHREVENAPSWVLRMRMEIRLPSAHMSGTCLSTGRRDRPPVLAFCINYPAHWHFVWIGFEYANITSYFSHM